MHHAIVTRVRSGVQRQRRPKRATRPNRVRDGRAPVGMGVSDGDRVAGWVPGQRPATFPDGDGFDFQPGDVLVAQIHYHYDGVVARRTGRA